MSLSKTLPIEPARAQQILRAHNIERAKHGLAPLEWDWSLAQAAQRWASQCRWTHWQQGERSIGSAAFRATQPPLVNGRWSLGENLAMTAGQPKSARAPVSAGGWIDERKDWTCGAAIQAANECKPGAMCGHLTQMLWADTKRVGCAIQECPNGFPELKNSQNAEFLVCEYSPPGNIVSRAPFPAAQCAIRPVSNPAAVPALIPPFPGNATGNTSGNTTIPFLPTEPTIPNGPNAPTNGLPRPPVGVIPILPPSGSTPLPNSLPPSSNGNNNSENNNNGSNSVALVSAPDGTEIIVPAALQQRVLQLTPEQLNSLAERTRNLSPAEQPFVVATFLQEIDDGNASDGGSGADQQTNAQKEAEFWKYAGIALGILAGIVLLSLIIWLIVWASRRGQKQSSVSSQNAPTSTFLRHPASVYR